MVEKRLVDFSRILRSQFGEGDVASLEESYLRGRKLGQSTKMAAGNQGHTA